jgi:pilus assembly protein Flp/PilA
VLLAIVPAQNLFLTAQPYGATTFHRIGVLRMCRFVAFLKDEKGATAIEYGLIAAGISVAIIAVVNGLGTSLNTKFSSVSTQLK